MRKAVDIVLKILLSIILAMHSRQHHAAHQRVLPCGNTGANTHPY
jgi:hypothetical protein